MLDIKLRQVGSVVVLYLSGKIDADSANLVELIGQCVRDGYTEILCNLEDVELIDYLGISVMIIAYREVINNQGRMKLTNVPAHLSGAFAISGTDRIIEIYVNEDLAVKSFKEDKAIEKIKKMHLRRRFKRLPIDLKIELKHKKDNSPECVKADILNLSAVGAFIFGCAKFRLGDQVVLKMKLGPKEEELQLDAAVVWVPDKEIQRHEYPGIGVEFRDISNENQQKLIQFIDRNLSFTSSD